MSDIQNILTELYKHTDALRNAIQPYNTTLVTAGFKPVANQSLSGMVKSGKLITGIHETKTKTE